MRFDALKSPFYRRFWFGSIASIGSTQLYFIAMAWLVFELTGSPLDLGMLGAATAIPTIIATLVGGIVADRLNRRSIMMATSLLATILLLILCILDWSNMVKVWHVLIISALLGLVQGFDFPSRASIFPSLISSDQMMSAVALNSILWQGTRMILPAFSGILIALTDTGFVFFISACGFVAMLLVLRTIDVRYESTIDSRPWNEFIDGIRYVFRRRIFRTLITLTFGLHFFATSYIQIMPVFADLLGGGERGYGILVSITGIGSVLGTVLISRFQESRRLGKIMLFSAFAAPLSLVGFSLFIGAGAASTSGFVIASLFIVVSSAFGSIFLVTSMTVLQLLVPEHYRGRVMGIHSITFSLIPLGGLFVGGLAALFAAPIAVIISCLIMLALVTWSITWHSEIRALNGRNLPALSKSDS
ncbi:MAG: MFS transporter [Acidiferrobacteraceae bacterium]|nr:MFS transporter [Acidiferrobacteraceae bacterium]